MERLPLDVLAERIKEEVQMLMDRNGLEHLRDFTIKIKSINENYLACYRGTTVFKSGAIFWVNENFYNMIDQNYPNHDEEEINKIAYLELRKTICHEVGHAVADMLRFMLRSDKNPPAKIKNFIGHDEEEFAEDFIYDLQFNQVSNRSFFAYYQKRMSEIRS